MLRLDHLKLEQFPISETKGLFTFYRQTQNYQKLIKQKQQNPKKLQMKKQKTTTQTQSYSTRARTLTQPKKQITKYQSKAAQDIVKISSSRCAVLNFSPKFNPYQHNYSSGPIQISEIIGSPIQPLIKNINGRDSVKNSSILSDRKNIKAIKNIEHQIILQTYKDYRGAQQKQTSMYQKQEEEIEDVFLRRRQRHKQLKKLNKRITQGNNSSQNQKDIISQINKKIIILQENQRIGDLNSHRSNELKMNVPSLNLHAKKSIKQIINQYRKKYQTSLNSNLFNKIKKMEANQPQSIDRSQKWKGQYKKMCNQQGFASRQILRNGKNQWKQQKRKHCRSIQIIQQADRTKSILQSYRIKSNKWKKNSPYKHKHHDFLLKDS